MTTTLHVHIQRLPEEKELTFLIKDLDPNIRLSFADDPSQNENVSILVSGRPKREEIDRYGQLGRLIIPWAGVPRETLDLLSDKPQIAIHNLHHNAVPVAEYALALMLAAAKNLTPMDRALRQSDWRPRYAPGTALLLGSRSALILGFGHIGRVLAGLLRSFNMQVMATRNTIDSLYSEEGVDVYPSSALPDLLPQTNFLIIALPHTPQTDGLIGQEELSLLPGNAIVVNIGRGAVVDQGALYESLKNHAIAGAGIDVWYNYPRDEAARASTPPADFPFHELDNIVMSPHRAGGLNSDDTERLRMSHLTDLLNAAARGEEMPNRVDPRKGY